MFNKVIFNATSFDFYKTLYEMGETDMIFIVFHLCLQQGQWLIYTISWQRRF
jgi:hypothetical protein